MPNPFLDDGDVRLYHGDALEQLALMPSESVQCIVTSPPFWGLRDYSCEGQIGLEETPDEWCNRLVAVMREARRVLRSDGVCWIEVGDTYNANQGGSSDGSATKSGVAGDVPNAWGGRGASPARARPAGLKPKDLVGAPWLLAFALRADGWYLRSDTIWARPNPMPESVTDRPTKAHSYVFLLTKSARYFFDSDAIREDNSPTSIAKVASLGVKYADRDDRLAKPDPAATYNAVGRNARSVWSIPTQPTPFAHFATFPEELVARCIKAGTSEHGACSECGAPWRRITETTPDDRKPYATEGAGEWANGAGRNDGKGARKVLREDGKGGDLPSARRTHVGWEPSCDGCYVRDESDGLYHYPAGVKPCVVLDPFMGSGTTALVARRLNRHAIGIELNAEYLAIAAQRLQQPTLWSDLAPRA